MDHVVSLKYLTRLNYIIDTIDYVLHYDYIVDESTTSSHDIVVRI